MNDFQVDDWMQLIDKDPLDITFKDQNGRFDDELIFLSTQKSHTHSNLNLPPCLHIQKQQEIETDKSDDSILQTLDCKSILKQDSEDDGRSYVDYSRLLDEQNMFDLFSPKMRGDIGSQVEVVEDAVNLAAHLMVESGSKMAVGEFVEELLVLMEEKMASREFEDVGEKLKYLKHELKMEKRGKQGKQGKQQGQGQGQGKRRDGKDEGEEIM